MDNLIKMEKSGQAIVTLPENPAIGQVIKINGGNSGVIVQASQMQTYKAPPETWAEFKVRRIPLYKWVYYRALNFWGASKALNIWFLK